VIDCAGQTASTKRLYYFTVVHTACEQSSECDAGLACIDGQCVEADCSIVWYMEGYSPDSGSVPTQETSRTEQAVREAYIAIYDSDPMFCSTDFVLCPGGEYACNKVVDGMFGSKQSVCQGGAYMYYINKFGMGDSGVWDVQCEPAL